MDEDKNTYGKERYNEMEEADIIMGIDDGNPVVSVYLVADSHRIKKFFKFDIRSSGFNAPIVFCRCARNGNNRYCAPNEAAATRAFHAQVGIGLGREVVIIACVLQSAFCSLC